MRALFNAKQDHRLLQDSISLTDPGLFDHQHIIGPKQITDIYLLALAVKHGVKLATFDANINLKAVKNATEAYREVLR